MLGELGTHRSDAGPGDFGIDGAGLKESQLTNRRIAEQVNLLERPIEHRAETVNDGDRSALRTLNADRRAHVTDLDPTMPCAAHVGTSTVGAPIEKPPLPPV
jgi:hypothetical protein